MGPITLKNGRTITPSYTAFLTQYGKRSDYDGIFDAQRGYISKSFYNLPEDERLDIFEIYLEYFLRQMYESYVSGDGKLGEPRIDESHISVEIRSSIENSSYDFMLDYGKYFLGGPSVREICLGIVDSCDEYYGYRAAIGFNNNELSFNKKLVDKILKRIQLVFKSIIELNPDMAAWYMLQGINLVGDAYKDIGGSEQ